PLLHVHGGDTGQEVAANLVLVAGVGVDDEPLTGTVVGALDLDFLFLLQGEIDVEVVGFGLSRRRVGLDGRVGVKRLLLARGQLFVLGVLSSGFSGRVFSGHVNFG